MTFDPNTIRQEAETILLRINTGEIGDACCMSAIDTPVTASWEAADRLSSYARLSNMQQQTILKTLLTRTMIKRHTAEKSVVMARHQNAAVVIYSKFG